MVPSIDVFMSRVAHILQQPFKFQTKNFVLKVRCSFIIEYFVFSFFFSKIFSIICALSVASYEEPLKS